MEEKDLDIIEKENDKKRRRKRIIRFIVVTSIMSALSTVLYFLRFPLPFLFPGFLKIQFSTLPLLILGFLEGPVAGIIALTVKTLISLPFSNSAYIGEFADFVIGTCVILTASLIYRVNKTKKGGIIALLFSSLAWILSGAIMNYFVLIPFYVNAFGLDAVVGMLSIIPNVNNDNYLGLYILFANIPFNLLLSLVVNIVTYLTYKKISNIVKRE